MNRQSCAEVNSGDTSFVFIMPQLLCTLVHDESQTHQRVVAGPHRFDGDSSSFLHRLIQLRSSSPSIITPTMRSTLASPFLSSRQIACLVGLSYIYPVISTIRGIRVFYKSWSKTSLLTKVLMVYSYTQVDQIDPEI